LEWRAEPRLTGENTPLIMVLRHEFVGLSITCAKLGIVTTSADGSPCQTSAISHTCHNSSGTSQPIEIALLFSIGSELPPVL
jgi:hypothetical protein